MTKIVVIFACISLLAAVPCSADVIYVKEGGTGSGSSWDDPNGVLQCAINNANSNDEVWVAAGTYKPTIKVGGSSDRYKTFQMKNGVEIYGAGITLPSDSVQVVGSLRHQFETEPHELKCALYQGNRPITSNHYDLTYYDSTMPGWRERLVRWLADVALR